MTDLRSWVLGLAGAAVVCAICTELTPKGRVKGVEKLLCGVVMTLALISPLLRLDYDAYALNLARYQQLAQTLSAETEEISDTLSRTFIAGKCRAYILDKAKELAPHVTDAAVTLRWSGEGYWYPVSVSVEGAYSEALSALIESELGVGREEQRWSGDEES